MAAPTTMKGNKLTVALGDGESAESFNAFCGINAKTVTFTKNTNEEFVWDCDDPDAEPWRELTGNGKFLSITGNGQLDTPTLDRYWEAFNSAESTNAQIIVDVTAGNGGGYWEGAFKLTTLELQGNNGEKAQVSISLESDGPITWVDAS